MILTETLEAFAFIINGEKWYVSLERCGDETYIDINDGIPLWAESLDIMEGKKFNRTNARKMLIKQLNS